MTVDISDELKGVEGDKIVRGRDKRIEQTRRIMAGSVSMHQVMEPELELTSATTARGIWSMREGRWQIASTKLVRTWKSFR